jgi:predicted membrane channel-forming protein YqfA (hemolysin III family)
MDEPRINTNQINEIRSESPSETKKVTLLSILGSVLAAMVGIQTENNQKRDFTSGEIGQYIIMGIVIVVVVAFIITLMTLVGYILDKTP